VTKSKAGGLKPPVAASSNRPSTVGKPERMEEPDQNYASNKPMKMEDLGPDKEEFQ
jgi:hypothetical protein